MARKRQLPDDDDIIVVQRASKLRKEKDPSTEHCDTKRPSTVGKQQLRRAKPTRSRSNVTNHSQSQQIISTEIEHVEGLAEARGGCKKASLKRSRDANYDTSSSKPKRNRHEYPPSPAETPSKTAAKMFDRLQLQGLKTPKEMGQITPPATPEGLKTDFLDMLPQELVELVAIHSAMVNAISAQLAVNVSAARINVKELLDMITSTWSKRAILLDDLRRILPLAQQAELAFMLEDFGRAGIFLVTSGVERTHKCIAVLDTVRLRKDFERVLRTKWQQWLQDGDQEKANAASFIETLPLSALAVSESVRAAAPLFSRGKQRLADLKTSQAIATEARISSTKTAIRSDNDTTISGRGSSLLDRILAKQAHNAAMPAGPTKEQLERRSALHRVEEIARTLEVLSAGRARASFSMQSIVQQLQQSMRNPMSRVEVETCLNLMAEEIMPSFVSMVSSGMLHGVVITRNGRLGIADLKKRLADAGI